MRSETSTQRILDTIAAATADTIAAGRAWYPIAGRWRQEYAYRYDLNQRQAAGILAALSPRTQWAHNRAHAVTLAETGAAPNLNTAKAVAILDGADPAEVLAPLHQSGDKLYGQKVAAFWRCLCDPWHPDAVAVDVWAARVAIPDAPRWHLDRRSRYEAAAGAYRAAAAVLGWTPAETQAVAWCHVRGTAT